jgi:hypothetical protein
VDPPDHAFYSFALLILHVAERLDLSQERAGERRIVQDPGGLRAT